MCDKKDITFTVLDGDDEYQKLSTEALFSTMTEEQIKESMSDKYAYLDEDWRISIWIQRVIINIDDREVSYMYWTDLTNRSDRLMFDFKL